MRNAMPIPVNPEDRIPPIHPGEFLREDFMKPLNLSSKALATALRVPVSRVAAIVRERRNIDAEMALRLARYFRMSASFWMNCQTQYDLTTAQDRLQSRIRREVRPAPRNRKTGELKPASIA
jgi:addiction module HigA family antidote